MHHPLPKARRMGRATFRDWSRISDPDQAFAFIPQVVDDRPALNSYERVIAASIVNPRHVDIGMDDIGGLYEVKRTLVSP